MENSQFVDPAAKLADLQAEIMQNTLVKINSHCSEITRVTQVGLSNLTAPNAEFLKQMHQEQRGDSVEDERSRQAANRSGELQAQCNVLTEQLISVARERDRIEADNKKAVDNAQSLSSALEQQLQDKQDEIESLKSRGVEDSVTKDSQEYRQKTSNQIQSLKQDNTKLRQKLKTSEEKRDIYEQQAKMFREWIQQKDIVPEIDDAVITVKFGKLIENIQRVILTSYKVSVALPTPEEADRPLVKELYSQFQLRLTPSELQNRIRGLVFYTLRNCILLQASFGLAYTEENIPIEYGLTEFEKLINEKPKISTTKIAEWRTMTLGLAQALRPTEVAPNCCQNTAVEIMQALNPLEKHKHGEEKNKLRNHWEQLCTDAFELTMMLRSHKDAYRCEIPQEGQALSNEDAEAQASECTGRAENGTDSDELIAAYALSGALVRYPANDPGKRIVLQKALVIVKGPCK